MLRISLGSFVATLLLFTNASVGQAEAILSKPIVKLSPTIHRLYTQPFDFLFNPFNLHNVQILQDAASKSVSRVIGNPLGSQLIDSRLPIYISGNHSQEMWGIYREVSFYTREETKVLVIRKIADAHLQSATEQNSTLKVTHQSQEIAVNDIALPLRQGPDSPITLASLAPAITSNVKIVGTLTGTDYVGENQAVILNRGSDDGLVVGHMFELFQSAVTTTDDIDRPVERSVGKLVVTYLHPQFSVATIVESVEAISIVTKVLPVKFQ